MSIDYKKFNEYSEKTRLRITVFAKLLLSTMEIYGPGKIPLSNFERESFSFEEGLSSVKMLNGIFGEVITGFRRDVFWEGPMATRTSISYVHLSYKTEAPAAIKLFLKEITKGDVSEKRVATIKSLKGCKIEFDDSLARMTVDDRIIQFPPYGKEHIILRVMFERRRGEPVDWSIVYNHMQSRNDGSLPDKEKWRFVYDACNAVNKRIQELLQTEDRLFECSKKTVKRLY